MRLSDLAVGESYDWYGREVTVKDFDVPKRGGVRAVGVDDGEDMITSARELRCPWAETLARRQVTQAENHLLAEFRRALGPLGADAHLAGWSVPANDTIQSRTITLEVSPQLLAALVAQVSGSSFALDQPLSDAT
jgi:hypothetical protein